jgi:hypothetical protein
MRFSNRGQSHPVYGCAESRKRSFMRCFTVHSLLRRQVRSRRGESAGECEGTEPSDTALKTMWHGCMETFNEWVPPPCGSPISIAGPHTDFHGYGREGADKMELPNRMMHVSPETCPSYNHEVWSTSSRDLQRQTISIRITRRGTGLLILSSLFIMDPHVYQTFWGASPQSHSLGVGSTNRDSRRVELRSWSRSFTSSPPVG